MRLQWSALAMADRDGIFDFIEGDSPRAAVAVDDAIRQRVALLLEFPEAGRIGRLDGTRELVITKTPYVVVYQIADEVVLILRVLHGAQLWPEELPEL